MDLRSAEPNWAADPIPNSPRNSASNLLRSARAGILPALNVVTTAAAAAAVANAVVEIMVFHLLLPDSAKWVIGSWNITNFLITNE